MTDHDVAAYGREVTKWRGEHHLNLDEREGLTLRGHTLGAVLVFS